MGAQNFEWGLGGGGGSESEAIYNLWFIYEIVL